MPGQVNKGEDWQKMQKKSDCLIVLGAWESYAQGEADSNGAMG